MVFYQMGSCSIAVRALGSLASQYRQWYDLHYREETCFQEMRRVIAGVGVDIVEINRIARGIEQHGDAFLERVYTQGERDYCAKKRTACESLAARFAAKEAVYKALRIDVPIRWKDIEVTVDSKGCPSVRLHGLFLEHARKHNITDILLSLSHSKEYAVAYAVAVTDR